MRRRAAGRGASAALLWDLARTGKPRVTLLFLLTGWVGSVLASGRLWPWWTPWLVLGLGLTVAGAGSLNQFLERDRDGLMERTRGRALPQGRLSSGWVFAFGMLVCVLGVAILGVRLHPLSAVLAGAGATYYLVVYTILLKPRSRWSAVAGGPAGIFPFLVGWAAGGHPPTLVTLHVCALVFLWSPAHFWALALARPKDYEGAGIPTPVSARGDRHAGLLVFLYAVSTIAVSLLPVVGGDFGAVYLSGAVLAGAVFGIGAVRVWRRPVEPRAWFLHKVSGVYLAAILVALVVDRVW